VDFQDLTPAASAGLFTRFSFDAGSTYASGASDYTTSAAYWNATAGFTHGGSTTFANLSPATAQAVQGAMEFTSYGSKFGTMDLVTFLSGTGLIRLVGSSMCNVAGTASHLLIGFVAQNSTAGRIRLYGMT
jgi:hypothetical protein